MHDPPKEAGEGHSSIEPMTKLRKQKERVGRYCFSFKDQFDTPNFIMEYRAAATLLLHDGGFLQIGRCSRLGS